MTDEITDDTDIQAQIPKPAFVYIPPRVKHFDDREQKIVASRLWLISFTDLFSIMLCFFILIFSTRDIDLTKIRQMNPTDKSIASITPDKSYAVSEGAAAKIERVVYADALNLDYLQGVVKTFVAQAGLEKDVSVIAAAGNLQLVIKGADVFQDKYAVSLRGLKIIKGLAPALARLSNRVSIIGTTPDSGAWAQGLAYASAFSNAMADNGYRKNLTVLADGQGRTLGIEIHIEADDGQIR
jgi:hypothetical protein